jgi:hypothetical protein
LSRIGSAWDAFSVRIEPIVVVVLLSYLTAF